MWRVLLLACLATVAAVVGAPSPAHALPPPDSPFVFNEPFVQQVGPEVFVFDWSAQKCEDNDIPDEPARAFRDSSGQVQLMDTHYVNYRSIAPALDGTYSHPCTKTMSSSENCTASNYNYREWLASPWTPDGATVYALVHMEYQGLNCVNGCPSNFECWYNAITSATSTNSGATFTQPNAPAQLVATIPYQFSMDGPNGYFLPSNTVRSRSGWFYAMFRAEDKGLQQMGTCIMRTRDLSDPTSWRAWNGTGFTVQFKSPYSGTIDPAQHVCAPVDFMSIGTMTESLTYNTYFKKWMLVGASVGDTAHNKPPGIYYSLSDDLLNWTNAALLMEAEIRWIADCNKPDPIKDPSILDPSSPSRNFETVGQRAQLFYTLWHFTGCSGTLDRDLIRIPIEFSNQQPGGPTAALSTSTQSAKVGEPVRFDASASTDHDGSIKSYKWDMDGDGKFDRNTGTDPRTRNTYYAPRRVTVRVRVSDDDGKFTDETRVVQIRR